MRNFSTNGVFNVFTEAPHSLPYRNASMGGGVWFEHADALLVSRTASVIHDDAKSRQRPIRFVFGVCCAAASVSTSTIAPEICSKSSPCGVAFSLAGFSEWLKDFGYGRAAERYPPRPTTAVPHPMVSSRYNQQATEDTQRIFLRHTDQKNTVCRFCIKSLD